MVIKLILTHYDTVLFRKWLINGLTKAVSSYIPALVQWQASKKKQWRQRSSLLFGGKNSFNSMPHYKFSSRKILRKWWIEELTEWMLQKNGWSSGSHQTKPPPTKNGFSFQNFSSNHPCCYSKWQPPLPSLISASFSMVERHTFVPFFFISSPICTFSFLLQYLHLN